MVRGNGCHGQMRHVAGCHGTDCLAVYCHCHMALGGPLSRVRCYIGAFHALVGRIDYPVVGQPMGLGSVEVRRFVAAL